MIRTQIYLTERQRKELAVIGRNSSKRQSELIREAVDRFIEQASRLRAEKALRDAAGLWKDRPDLPDYDRMRTEWDRA